MGVEGWYISDSGGGTQVDARVKDVQSCLKEAEDELIAAGRKRLSTVHMRGTEHTYVCVRSRVRPALNAGRSGSWIMPRWLAIRPAIAPLVIQQNPPCSVAPVLAPLLHICTHVQYYTTVDACENRVLYIVHTTIRAL